MWRHEEDDWRQREKLWKVIVVFSLKFVWTEMKNNEHWGKMGKHERKEERREGKEKQGRKGSERCLRKKNKKKITDKGE